MKNRGSVFKFLRCACGLQHRVKEVSNKAPLCPKCGANTAYSKFWYISYRTQEGKEVRSPINTDKKMASNQLKRILDGIWDKKTKDTAMKLK
jgi:hypothetical protein